MRVGAVDLGGTHVTGATVDVGSGTVSAPVRVSIDPHDPRDELLAAIARAAQVARIDGVDRLGLAVPGPFDYEHGICTIEGVGKLDSLRGVDLRQELAAVLELEPDRIRFLNDAEAFTRGEVWLGAARGYDRVIGVTLGTGLGSAFLDRGTAVRTGDAVPPGGELYPEQFRGAPVEDRLSRRGILARFGRPELDVVDIAALAHEGDAQAQDVFNEFGSELAEFLTPWVFSYAADRVVIGGSISRAWDLVAAALESLPAVQAQHIDDAPLFGAARYALS
jgi:glucokinase